MKFGDIFSGFISNTSKNKLISTFGLMILFVLLFDGIIMYLLPLVITEQGFSKTLLGIIFATAAISGAFFDFTIYKIFKTSFFRRLFIVMFAVCFLYLFTVWNANSFFLFVCAMAMWGFYYDLKNFATLDFVSRYYENKELSSKFGILQIFQSIGYLLAPLITGFLIIESVGWEPFALALVFLSISLFFFILLLIEVRNKKQYIPSNETRRKRSILEDFNILGKTGKLIFPLLCLACFATIFDSFFMTLGPIVAENLDLEPFDGLFMVAYYLPLVFIGGFIGNITNKFGEKKTALFGLLIGALILSTLFFFENPIFIILIVFISSCFTCMKTPVIQSIYAHCIHEAPKSKKEVQELGDFFSNCGYIVGPVIAGLIADNFGALETFSFLGCIGIVFAIILFIFIPEKTSLKKNK
ncbi:MAG: MFS transporter [Candidatus Micrarchaeia archaeon]